MRLEVVSDETKEGLGRENLRLQLVIFCIKVLENGIYCIHHNKSK